MELAFECPVCMFSFVQPLADYDFCLAHKVLEDPRYATFYRESEKLKFLDNSCNELREPLSLTEIGKAASIVDPTFIVAPDYLRDSKRTLEGLIEAKELFGIAKVFPVIQGSTKEEVKDLAESIRSMGFNWVAVPYDILGNRSMDINKLGRLRMGVVELLRIEGFKWIHLLGLNSLREVASYQDKPEVQTLDTGAPISNGLRGKRFGRDKLLDKKAPTWDRMHNVDYDYDRNGDILYNIGYLRKVVRKNGRHVPYKVEPLPVRDS